MNDVRKYPQPHNIVKDYDTDRVDIGRIHNGAKRGGDGDPVKKYQIFLRTMKKRRNGHKTRVYKTS